MVDKPAKSPLMSSRTLLGDGLSTRPSRLYLPFFCGILFIKDIKGFFVSECFRGREGQYFE